MFRTEKFKLIESCKVIDYQDQFSSAFRYAYERFKEGKTEKEIRKLINELEDPIKKTKYFEGVNSWLIQCAIKSAQAEFDAHVALGRDTSVVWGGKQNFKKLQKDQITKEEWYELRQRPIISQGEKLQKSNRLFDLTKLNQHTIIYKPNAETKLPIQFHVGKNQQAQLNYLIKNIGKIAITVTFDKDYICLSYEQEKLPLENQLTNRYLAVDMNPQTIGVTIIDFVDGKERLVKAQTFELNNEVINDPNKRDYETAQIAHAIMKMAKHYRVGNVVLEKLTMGAKDNKKGRNFNKLVNNNWNRNQFNWLIQKLCDKFQIEFIQVNCAYSSTIGNTLHRYLPDACAAAWEIARRGFYKYEKKLCMYPPTNFDRLPILRRWKNARKLESIDVSSWKELHDVYKSAKLKYRVSLKSLKLSGIEFCCSRSGITCLSDFYYFD